MVFGHNFASRVLSIVLHILRVSQLSPVSHAEARSMALIGDG